MIKQWQEILSNEHFDRSHILNHPSYGALRALLVKDILSDLERAPTNIVIPIGPTNYDKDILLKEIARIEKMWGLI